MEKMNDYETTEAFTGEYEKLKLGGQICEIRGARIEKSQNQNDMLVVAFDIAEGENRGYFKRRFDEATKRSGADAKWPNNGIHRILLKDSEGKCNKYFKGFITSVEASNKGYTWDWNEEGLKGKRFGGIFGREQYEANDGNLKFATKLRWIRSVDKVKNAEIPEDKLLSKKPADNVWGEVIDSDENLPF